jgi:hypothetical protein
LRGLIFQQEGERVYWQQVINSAIEEEAEREYRRTHNKEDPPDGWSPQQEVEQKSFQQEQPHKKVRKMFLKTPEEFLQEKLEDLNFDDLLESEKETL